MEILLREWRYYQGSTRLFEDVVKAPLLVAYYCEAAGGSQVSGCVDRRDAYAECQDVGCAAGVVQMGWHPRDVREGDRGCQWLGYDGSWTGLRE